MALSQVSVLRLTNMTVMGFVHSASKTPHVLAITML